MEISNDWYIVKNIAEVDSPALLVYLDRAKQNIETLVKSIDDSARLRPHVKTHKSAEISQLMMQAGIKKFKCATIAEAEMLANAGAPDVLLAYQPVGPKAKRLAELVEDFPKTKFSCLIDNFEPASHLSNVFKVENSTLQVYIDLNVGMNRTGVVPKLSTSLYNQCAQLKGIRIVGLHVYDGHLRDTDYEERKRKCDLAFSEVEELKRNLETSSNVNLIIVAGGTPTYSIHSKRKLIECSPGTFIYWDKGYEQALPEQRYKFAGLVLTRVISKPSEDLICVDLGHKSIASENPLNNRVYFLNAPELQPMAHSEEHMVLKCNGTKFNIGDVLYGVPHHICPTVALYDEVSVVEKQHVSDHWYTISRNRKITI
jgi:D-serine deaminase-like pyridoxal phosphate-dependent protein